MADFWVTTAQQVGLQALTSYKAVARPDVEQGFDGRIYG